jgi:hypothetical protein
MNTRGIGDLAAGNGLAALRTIIKACWHSRSTAGSYTTALKEPGMGFRLLYQSTGLQAKATSG